MNQLPHPKPALPEFANLLNSLKDRRTMTLTETSPCRKEVRRLLCRTRPMQKNRHQTLRSFKAAFSNTRSTFHSGIPHPTRTQIVWIFSNVFAPLFISVDQPARFVLLRKVCFPTRSNNVDQINLLHAISPLASALIATHSPQATQTSSGIKFKFFNRDCRLTE